MKEEKPCFGIPKGFVELGFLKSLLFDTGVI